MHQRSATLSELTKLNDFIRTSKGFWGYSESFLDFFMEKYGLKEFYFSKNEIILLEEETELLGLYAFKLNYEGKPELDLFFINADKIRQGIGKTMWQYAIQYASRKGWKEFMLIADPNAENFYKCMGAETVQQFESFPGRFVPIMRVEVNTLITRRPANAPDLDFLNSLITKSRKHIGYSAENNQFFLENFGLTLDYINNHLVLVYEKNAKIIAVLGMSFTKQAELDYFFITPEMIGRGLGRKMWHEVCAISRDKNVTNFEFIANPYAVLFYRHMGAEIIADYGIPAEGMKRMRYICT
ncbi:GNAT family N-acetyltransferase [Legionella cardiaca]|uniref:GNAT family N-acetyltransferase n=1 Tax=Legionella cardiaca TaxID=1071983 RepID=A0ABY8AUA6_9GAMM|nr:GNAT family N-acetyltransferase [Legionella cardiaca]WED44024.1 GNAT family N-acetyltransferase [Legionella cardiaca]